MMDQQIIEKPKCNKCKINNAVVAYKGILICLECYQKYEERRKKEQNLWLQE